MKKLILFLFAIGVINCASAQTSLPQHDWHVTLKIVDESGQLIAGASVNVGFYWVTPPPYGKYTAAGINGLTDTNGVFKASHTAEFCTLHFVVQKTGYYTTGSQYNAGSEYDQVKWNPTLTLVLKKVGQPIAMYAKWVQSGPPVFNQTVGYDLMAGAWVAPHGMGQMTDIIFDGKLDKKAPNDFDYTLTISFPNAGDGIQQFSRTNDGSGFESPREAPTNGYLPSVVRTMSRHPDRGNQDDSDKTRNYFFRVRTILDEKGNIKSALYGKIYGDFMDFCYYINPESNSRNMEFDPKQNLNKNAKSEGSFVP